MSNNNNKQAIFIETLNSLKEYAKVNGGIVSREDVISYFNNLDLDNCQKIELDDEKIKMIFGYLRANNINVIGEDSNENEFLKMMETQKDLDVDEMSNVEVEEENQAIKNIQDNLDYDEDDKNYKLYLDEINTLPEISDERKAELLRSIVNLNDKLSMEKLIESFLKKIVKWIEPFMKKGVLSSDLVQEANLYMTAYINDKRFENNVNWMAKLEEDSLYVYRLIEKDIHENIICCINQLIDEQTQSNKITGKVLGKVNLVNDWATRLESELQRKPTVEELAQRMGISVDNVMEAINLSAENIEKIQYNKNQELTE